MSSKKVFNHKNDFENYQIHVCKGNKKGISQLIISGNHDPEGVATIESQEQLTKLVRALQKINDTTQLPKKAPDWEKRMNDEFQKSIESGKELSSVALNKSG